VHPYKSQILDFISFTGVYDFSASFSNLIIGPGSYQPLQSLS